MRLIAMTKVGPGEILTANTTIVQFDVPEQTCVLLLRVPCCTAR